MTSKLKVNLINDSGDNNIFTSDGSCVITSSKFKVGQVLSTTKTDSFQSTATSVTDITGLSVAITPTSTSSKVLVMVHGNVSDGGPTYEAAMKMFRDSTEICKGDNGSATNIGFDNARRNSGGNESKKFSMTFLDSPNTTSSTTYKIAVKVDQSGSTFNFNRTASSNNSSLVSTITVMEILP